ncbi:HAD hydrolase-like protein [Pseudonocardia sp. N23]|uniref:HAD hydrolase-like protein n=1 Tax=Pseudonocardia sp. N23 TaxID=1987376 RepID=UPI000C02BF16|nr:HAD hydrolase-like protein [Pseudonocardia sp. N23]GAY09937.1 phosphoglycolate phosphatase [Pseudonocardia sp. N23]
MSTLPAAVLFDLDGTVVDSAASILGCLAEAFAEIGVTPPPAALDRTILGPPLAKALPPLVGTEVTAEVLQVYRRLYADHGPAAVRVFPGVEDVVRRLDGLGVVVAIATSKSQVNADLIIEHLGLDDVFATVCGDTPDSARPTKAHVIAEVLRRIGNPAAVMVGDRHLDVVGARVHGLPFVGAGWGYGLPDELVVAGAEVICADADELAAALGVVTAPTAP